MHKKICSPKRVDKQLLWSPRRRGKNNIKMDLKSKWRGSVLDGSR
jgi:hypothetical protein